MNVTKWHRKDDIVRIRFSEIKDLRPLRITISFVVYPDKALFKLSLLRDLIVQKVYSVYKNRLAISNALGISYRGALNVLKRDGELDAFIKVEEIEE